MRLIWTSIFLASLGVTGWIMSWNIVAFLQYGVVSSTKVVYENPTQFPAVTICDYNPFTCKKGNDLVSDIFDRTECQDSVIGPLNCALNLASMIASDPSYGDENRKKLGLHLDQIECIYNNKECKNDLHWYWSYKYGNCFQFNAGLNYDNNNIDTPMKHILLI